MEQKGAMIKGEVRSVGLAGVEGTVLHAGREWSVAFYLMCVLWWSCSSEEESSEEEEDPAAVSPCLSNPHNNCHTLGTESQHKCKYISLPNVPCSYTFICH